MTLGAATGGVLGGWLVDRAGRKLSLLLCTVPFVVGFAVITAAQNVWMLLGGRLLTGLACGIASLVAPVSVPQPRALGPGRSGPGGAVLPGCGLLGAWHRAPPGFIFLRPRDGPWKEPLLSLFTDEVSFRN